MKKIFVIDWVLIPAFALSFFTGLGLHAAGHGHHHGGWWHVWTFLHILTSLAFLIAVVFHVTASGLVSWDCQGRNRPKE